MNSLRSSIFSNGTQPLFSFSDTESFFAFMVDNLLQYLIIVILLTTVIGIPRKFVVSSVLSATAVCLVEHEFRRAGAWMAEGVK